MTAVERLRHPGAGAVVLGASRRRCRRAPLFLLNVLGLSLLFLDKQEEVDLMMQAMQVSLECLAYTGTGNVLKIQKMLCILGEHFDEEDAEEEEENKDEADKKKGKKAEAEEATISLRGAAGAGDAVREQPRSGHHRHTQPPRRRLQGRRRNLSGWTCSWATCRASPRARAPSTRRSVLVSASLRRSSWPRRCGNEKDTDEEADTVGVCSLRKEHIALLQSPEMLLKKELTKALKEDNKEDAGQVQDELHEHCITHCIYAHCIHRK